MSETMMDLMVEMDYLGKDINSFISTGEVIARLEKDTKHFCLETSGEEGDIYLEIVEYDLGENGDYLDSRVSYPIYVVPTGTEDVEELFENWLMGKMIDKGSLTGGKEVFDKRDESFQYWMFENGEAIKPLSPPFADQKDLVAWMEKHYQ